MSRFSGNIVPTDADPHAAGFALADRHYVVPPSRSNQFMDEAIKIVREEEIDVILPTPGFDIGSCSESR